MNFRKIFPSLVLMVLLISSVLVVSGYPIAGKVVEISPTEVYVSEGSGVAVGGSGQTGTVLACPYISCPAGQIDVETGKHTPEGCSIYECKNSDCSIAECRSQATIAVACSDGINYPKYGCLRQINGTCEWKVKTPCPAVCGNGICEEGEANFCPPCTAYGCKAPCTAGTCPQDCTGGRVGGGCDVDLCKRFLCCKGTNCPAGFPKQCEGCTDDICKSKKEPVCGNNICEEGEANFCPPCNSEPCPAISCRVGTCPKDCEVAKPAKPICENIGTKTEGWYFNGKLLKYDRCACVAVCKKAVGVENEFRSGYTKEGYYSSCTGDLIQLATCSYEEPIVIKIRGKPTEIRQNTEDSVVQIKSEDTATTKEKLTLTGNKIEISTTEGAKEIKYLPEEAKQKAMQVGQINQVTNIRLIKEDEKPVYIINGQVKDYFLWFIPITKEKEVKINAETNEFVSSS